MCLFCQNSRTLWHKGTGQICQFIRSMELLQWSINITHSFLICHIGNVPCSNNICCEKFWAIIIQISICNIHCLSKIYIFYADQMHYYSQEITILHRGKLEYQCQLLSIDWLIIIYIKTYFHYLHIFILEFQVLI